MNLVATNKEGDYIEKGSYKNIIYYIFKWSFNLFKRYSKNTIRTY